MEAQREGVLREEDREEDRVAQREVAASVGQPREVVVPARARVQAEAVEPLHAAGRAEAAVGPSAPNDSGEAAEVRLAPRLAEVRAEAGHQRLREEAEPILHPPGSRRAAGLVVGEGPRPLREGEHHSPSRTCGDLGFAWSSWDR